MYNYSPFEKLITCNQKTSRSVEKNSNYLYDNVHDNIKSPNGFKSKNKKHNSEEFLLIPKQFTVAPLKSLYNPLSNIPLYKKKHTLKVSKSINRSIGGSDISREFGNEIYSEINLNEKRGNKYR